MSEPATRVVEVAIPMTWHRTSGTPVVNNRTPDPQRSQRTAVIGAHWADIPTGLHHTLNALTAAERAELMSWFPHLRATLDQKVLEPAGEAISISAPFDH